LYNYDNYPTPVTEDDYYPPGSALYSYSCTGSTMSQWGTGDINANPQLFDLFHITATSPCRGTGSPLYATGTDLDGEPWNNPPSMGCDEVVLANLVGPLSLALRASPTNLLVNHPTGFYANVTGRASRIQWSFGDGTIVTNTGCSISHQWTNTGDSFVGFTAFNTDNPGGVSTNLPVHIVPLMPPQLQPPVMTSNTFQVHFTGQAGAFYFLQVATDLTPPVSWQTVRATGTSTDGVCLMSDTWTISNARRFYRVTAE
jgi:hypothetical protein